jgi:hypothetical protein
MKIQDVNPNSNPTEVTFSMQRVKRGGFYGGVLINRTERVLSIDNNESPVKIGNAVQFRKKIKTENRVITLFWFNGESANSFTGDIKKAI